MRAAIVTHLSKLYSEFFDFRRLRYSRGVLPGWKQPGILFEVSRTVKSDARSVETIWSSVGKKTVNLGQPTPFTQPLVQRPALVSIKLCVKRTFVFLFFRE